MRRIVRITLLRALLAMLAQGLLCTGTAAETAELPEYQLKAAFIYNFAKFITWPANTFAAPDSEIVLAILGDDPFGPQLKQTLAGKMVNGHPIRILYVPSGDPLTSCHILFVASSEKERLNRIFAGTAGQPILTVGDCDRFAHRGGMINLFLEGKAIRFEINANATERAGFKVSSKLGGLGVIVRGDVIVKGAM